MPEFWVFDRSASGRLVVLHECPGVFHVAVSPSTDIPMHHRVYGECLDVGPCTMYDRDSCRPVALVVEQTGCTLPEALELLDEEQ
jgi:hypothetical protein